MGLALGHHIPGAVGDAPPVPPCSFVVVYDGPTIDNFSSPGGSRRDVVISPDGLRAWTHWTISFGGNDTHQYDLPGPWDFAGARTNTGNILRTGSLNRSMTWHDNGDKLSFLRRWFSGFRRMDTWDQSATPFDISAGLGPVFASFTGLISSEYNARFSLDGFHVFINRISTELRRYTMTVAHDISTITGVTQFYSGIPVGFSDTWGFSTDHTKIYFVSGTLLASIDLTAPDDISAPFNFVTGVSTNLPTNLGVPRGLTIRPDNANIVLWADQNNQRTREWGGVLGVTQDPNFSDVVLLLDFAGADGAQAITDLSNSAHTETFIDNAQVNTAIRHLGVNTLLLDGVGDEVTYPTSPDWAFGTGDFTIEFGLKLDAVTTMTLLSIFDTSVGWFIRSLQSGGQKFVFGHGASDLINASWTVPVGATEHIAITRQGTTLSVWQEGALLASVTDSTNFTQGTKALRLGSLDGLTQFTDGTIGAVRITEGLARYTAPFTPPVCFYPSAGP